MTPRAPHPWVPAPARVYPSAQILRRAAFAKRRACPAAVLPITTRVALILPHKSLISFLGGAIGADIYLDRAGIMCRTVKDAAKVSGCAKRSRQRLLRSARHFHDGSQIERFGQALLRQHQFRRALAARCAECASGLSANRC